VRLAAGIAKLAAHRGDVKVPVTGSGPLRPQTSYTREIELGGGPRAELEKISAAPAPRILVMWHPDQDRMVFS
jgi:hypothetical protein